MQAQVVQRALRQYGVTTKDIMPVQKGYRNESHGVAAADGKHYNLILYKQEPGITDKIHLANRASNYLAEQGLPCRQTQSDKIIVLSAPNFKQYGALYNYLPGETIPWEAYNQTHIKLLGMAMGRMHALLAKMPTTDYPNVVTQTTELLKRMHDYFSEPGVISALATKTATELDADIFDQLSSAVQSMANADNQVLHMDFVRGNILFSEAGSNDTLELDDTAITGILDFEKVAQGPIEFDVARTLAFLLVDCKYKPADKVRKYFLESGYIKRGEGRALDDKLLEQLLDVFLLHDFYKFLLHNPYEFLSQNEHFVRTRAILLGRKVISAT